MNNDRELLELAAKAAGLDGYRWVGAGMALAIDPSKAETGSIGPNWNPLSNDGDALRLAVKLAIDLYFHEAEIEATAFQSDPDEHGVYPFGIEPAGDNACAATRRAIVRAAAEIGRAMK